MKLFFLLLVLLNLLFAGWQYYQPTVSGLVVPPLPAQLETLVLLSESGRAIQSSGPNKSSPEPDTSELAAVATTKEESIACFTLGPFTDAEQIRSIQQEMTPVVKASELRKRVEKELHRYWIYLPAARNRAAAIESSKSLARDKIKDYYIVHGGEHNNRVSLGHYKEKLHADRRMAQLQKLGYEPVMEPIYRDYDVFWLDYSIAAGDSEHDPANRYVADEVSRIARDCE